MKIRVSKDKMSLGVVTGHPSFVMRNSFTNQTLAQIAFLYQDFEMVMQVLPKYLDEKFARLQFNKIGVDLKEWIVKQSEYISIAIEKSSNSFINRYCFEILNIN